MTIKDICALFDIGGTYLSCKEIVSGNINSTYKVSFARDGESKEYILQKINKQVFKEPSKVMDNIVRITNHIRTKVDKRGESTRTGVLRVFYSKQEKKPYVVDDCGDYWRCCRFIHNSTTYDTCDDLEIIRKIGSAFGRFQNDLNDFPATSLFITIPDFHNTKARYQAFRQAIEIDPYQRASKVKEQTQKLFEYEKKACELQEHLDNKELPYRVTHNDTKSNNVSIDKSTGDVLAVLDLDTVMPGAIAHDFGDAIRFIANTRKEDDPRYDLVELDLTKYEAFAKGFVGEVGSVLIDLEKKTLNLGVFTMTVELALRFLTDYILGDKYFRNNYPGHNVDRAKNQIALSQSILDNFEQMEEILQKYL